ALPSVASIGEGASGVCLNSTTPAFTNATPGGTWSITNGTGSATITTGGVVTGVTAGNGLGSYKKASDGNGCANQTTTSLTVNSLPTITTSATATEVCFNTASQTSSITYSATSGTPTTYSITWSPVGLTNVIDAPI